MPEGDTVHKLANYLRPRLQGEALTGGRLRHADRLELAGRRVAEVQARGKHLFIALDDGRSLRSHLGMYGSWHRYARGEPWRRPVRQAGLVLETRSDVYVCFNPKEVELLATRGLRERDLQAHLGPDLIAEDADPAALAQRARTRLEPQTPLVDVLLDQRVACGIGNVYKSELLFLACEPPLRPLAEVEDTALGALYTRATALLRKNLYGGPRTTRWTGRDGGTLWVYGRKGQSCLRCGSPIRQALLGRDQRSTYWCERCQKR
jgi:endonuclease-8